VTPTPAGPACGCMGTCTTRWTWCGPGARASCATRPGHGSATQSSATIWWWRSDGGGGGGNASNGRMAASTDPSPELSTVRCMSLFPCTYNGAQRRCSARGNAARNGSSQASRCARHISGPGRAIAPHPASKSTAWNVGTRTWQSNARANHDRVGALPFNAHCHGQTCPANLATPPERLPERITQRPTTAAPSSARLAGSGTAAPTGV